MCRLKLIILSSRRSVWESEGEENNELRWEWNKIVDDPHMSTVAFWPCSIPVVANRGESAMTQRDRDRIYCYYFLTTGTPSTKKWRSKKSNIDCMASLGSPSCSSELKTFLSLPLNWSGGLGEQSTSTNDALWYIHIKFLAFPHIHISVHRKHTNIAKYPLLSLSATPDHFQSTSYGEAKQT